MSFRIHKPGTPKTAKNSKFRQARETLDGMQRIVEEIQNILQGDYVVVFRSYRSRN